MPSSRSSALAWWSAATIFVSAFLLFQVQPIISKKILPWFGGSPAVWTTCVLFFQLVLLGGYAYSHWLIRYVSPRWQGPIHITVLGLALLTFPITAAGFWNINPGDIWKPADGSLPALRILLLLAAKVGAPFFVASTTGPLVQAWFSQLYPDRSPFRLYALSNVGSLAALLTYPFLIESYFRVDQQGFFWALGFLLFAALVGYMGMTMYREAQQAGRSEAASHPQPVTASEGLVAKPDGTSESAPPAADAPPTTGLKVGWLLLAALASMSLLAFTNHLCQDIAVVPFMWVIPLSLYLLSFIICFDSERWYNRKFFGLATILAILWLTGMRNHSAVDNSLEWMQKKVASTVLRREVNEPWITDPFSKPVDKVFDGIDWIAKKLDVPFQAIFKPSWHLRYNVDVYDFTEHVFSISAAFMLVLFLICMVCHGELVKSKPVAKHLTSFYLYISAGGALGGLFVAVLCPLIFKSHFELSIAMIGGFAVGCIALLNDGRQGWLKQREVMQWSFAFAVVGAAFLVGKGNFDPTELERMISGLPAGVRTFLANWKIGKPDPDLVMRDRNFYGTAHVSILGDQSDPAASGRALYNGRIWHGFQYFDPARQHEPTTYYVPGTGAALAVMENPRKDKGLRVGIIGLGTGSMASHHRAAEGDRPADVYRFYDIDPKIVRIANEYFTYVKQSNSEIVLGDARIQMEQELKNGGSQNYDAIILDAFSSDAIPAHLLTVESFGLYEQHLRKDESGKPSGVIAIHISNRYLDLVPVVTAITKKYGYKALEVHKDEDDGFADTGSDWILVSKNEEFMNNPAIKDVGEELTPKKELLWTDQFTALFQILK